MGIKDSVKSLDRYLDGKVSDMPEVSRRRRSETPEDYEARIKGTFRSIGSKTKTTIRSIDGYGDKATGRFRRRKGNSLDSLLNATLNKPLITIIIVTVIALGIGTQAIYIVDNMRGDMEIYLPPGDPATESMNEVREDWSIDLVVILVETKDNDGDGHRDDITERDILLEMSFVEGDDTNQLNQDPFRGLDYNRKDKGSEDGFSYALSLASIVKAINETANNVFMAVGGGGSGVSISGTYSVPDQDTIDQIVSRISPEDMANVAKDTDGDGFKETGVIMLGVAPGQKSTDIIQRVDDVIAARATGMNTNVTLCAMTNTGPYVVIEKMRGVITAFIEVMPTMMVVLAAVLFFFHRSYKVVIIALVPVMLALAITLGMCGFISEYLPGYLIISPQIALILPVLIALGIAYGLYVSNQFVEEKEGAIEERVKNAIKKQNYAILLSASAEALGFGSLMVGTLPPIVTMGFALALGIILVYLFTVLIIPPIIVLLKYKKMAEYGTFKAIRTVPSNNRKKIVISAIVLLLVSVALIPMIRFDADFLAIMPSDDPSVKAMNRYSKEMDGGQMGMVLVRGDVYDYEVLKYVDKLADDIDAVKNSYSLSVVSLMKMVQSPDNVTIPRFGTIPLPANISFWELLSDTSNPLLHKELIKLFYDSLPEEMRFMFINVAGDKMLVYVFMPYMDTAKTEKAVNSVNDVIDTHGNPPGGTVSNLAGVAALTVAVNSLLIVGQFQSLALCIILTMVILIVVFKNWRLGVLTMIPCCIVVGLEPLVMVGMNIPLSLVTVMVGSIAIGTGVDFAIQISQRLNLYGMTIPNIHDAVENLGTSFVEATTTMVLGFAAILFAPWPGKGPYGLPVTFGIGIVSIRQFVVMMMLLLVFNAIMALFVHSAILTLWFRAKGREELRQKRLKQLERESIRRARAASMTMSDLEGPDELGTREGAPHDEDAAPDDRDDGSQKDEGGGGEGTEPDEEEEGYLNGEEELDDGAVRQRKEDDGYTPPELDTDDDIYVDRGRGRGRGLRK